MKKFETIQEAADYAVLKMVGKLSNYIDTSKPQYKKWVEMV